MFDKKHIGTAWLILQSVLLLVIGIGVFWWSEDLMFFLIHLVGEERALGTENVIVTENGAKLLTNPGAMMRWTIPVWIIALVQISAAASLATISWRRLRCVGNSTQ